MSCDWIIQTVGVPVYMTLPEQPVPAYILSQVYSAFLVLQRYCKDNPGRFRNADAAYMLSFAIIMLNTDAHNPMAERRLGRADFVVMNHQQTDDGMQPVLPANELEAIYDRIVASEIIVRGESTPGSAANQSAKAAAAARTRLAAAMGWTQLNLPFRSLGGWDKQRGADMERRFILETAEKEVAKGAVSGNLWHTATHAEHARPMLQVGVDSCQHSELLVAFFSAWCWWWFGGEQGQGWVHLVRLAQLTAGTFILCAQRVLHAAAAAVGICTVACLHMLGCYFVTSSAPGTDNGDLCKFAGFWSPNA